MADPTQRGEVIVGIDGSEGSKVALEWALARQDVLGPVRTVGVYSLSFPVATEAMMPPHRYDVLQTTRQPDFDSPG